MFWSIKNHAKGIYIEYAVIFSIKKLKGCIIMKGKKLWKEKTKQDLYRVGDIVGLCDNEIDATLKKRKLTLLIAILLTLLGILMLSGCIHTLYVAVSIHDFSWLWRLI